MPDIFRELKSAKRALPPPSLFSRTLGVCQNCKNSSRVAGALEGRGYLEIKSHGFVGQLDLSLPSVGIYGGRVGERLRLADLLGGLSMVADLGFGLPPGMAVRTSLIATALARRTDEHEAVVRDGPRG